MLVGRTTAMAMLLALLSTSASPVPAPAPAGFGPSTAVITTSGALSPFHWVSTD